jgi:hypothetical protein
MAVFIKVDYDLWRSAPKQPFNRNRFRYNGTGMGLQRRRHPALGPHRFNIARWGLRKQEHR